eukprot:COSAG02_NODE_48621_length_332_cov_0.974249_1_plen_39_part_10
MGRTNTKIDLKQSQLYAEAVVRRASFLSHSEQAFGNRDP